MIVKIAAKTPRDMSSLKSIKGIGSITCQTYGDKLVAIVNQHYKGRKVSQFANRTYYIKYQTGISKGQFFKAQVLNVDDQYIFIKGFKSKVLTYRVDRIDEIYLKV